MQLADQYQKFLSWSKYRRLSSSIAVLFLLPSFYYLPSWSYIVRNQSDNFLIEQIRTASNPMQYAIPEDEYRTAVILPCTMIESVIMMPKALESITESQDRAHEVIVVFGMSRDLEDAMNSLYPPNLTSEMDNARAHLRNFILKWVKEDTPAVKKMTQKSHELNTLSPYDSLTPAEFLAAFNLSGYLEEEKVKYEDKEWDDMPVKYRFGSNLLTIVNDEMTIDEIASKLPNFKIVLNRNDYPYAGSNREAGMYTAFNSGEPRHNDIISFVDCDDMVTPHRQHMVEQAFKENPDIDMIAHQFTLLAFDKQRGDDDMFTFVDKTEAGKMKEVSDVLLQTPKDLDTKEFRESLYEKYFDFRNPETKAWALARQDDPEFLLNNDKKLIPEPWDIRTGNHSDGHNFNWWLGSTAAATFTKSTAFAVTNGHTSWRHDWLVNGIQHFPNSDKGEDARLTYMSTMLGGRALAIPLPLTLYAMPSGSTKRSLLSDVKLFNEKTK